MKKFTKNPFYEEILKEAIEEANKSSKNWMIENTKDREKTALLGDCGLSFIKITDKRWSFVKYYIQRELVKTGQKYNRIYIPHENSGRLEIGPKYSAMVSAMNVFKKYSVDAGLEIKTFID
ncbi:hypothetical protein GW796_09305 [archaeon]|nr:hypothetical protein [archaeon]NCT58925.1 hypothetical protein [archaeon]